MSLRVVFLGTPVFAVPTLTRLITSPHNVVGVITQPDRPRGRGHYTSAPPIKELALRHHIPVFQPSRLSDAAFRREFDALEADLGIVAAFGRLLPEWLLGSPTHGMINVHASLLPRWRGAAPVHRAILAGDRVTGVTIMRVVLELDAGPMLSTVTTDIDPNETSEMLEHRLAHHGADEVLRVIDQIASGTSRAERQDESAVTYASKLTRADSEITWARPSRAVHDHIRGVQPWPMAVARLNNRRLLLVRSEVEHEHLLDAEPGGVVAIDRDSISIACRPGVVRLLDVQPEGRSVMTVRAFLNGARVSVGDRFH